MRQVLVVDDDQTITALLTEALEDEGYAPAIAVGPAALIAAQTQQPAVILMDIAMPGLDGLEIARRLRADERTRHIPIVLMSAAGRLRERAGAAPVDAVVTKPFDLDEVLTMIDRLTKHQSLQGKGPWTMARMVGSGADA